MRALLRQFEGSMLSNYPPWRSPWLPLIDLVNSFGTEVVCLPTPRCGQLAMAYTALHYAALYGKADYATLLLRRGAPVDARSALKATPLFITATFPKRSLETARVLLFHGADVNSALDDGTTPLIHAVSTGSREMACVLLESGANPSATRRIQKPASCPGLGYILDRGEDTCDRRTALFTAIWLGDCKMARALVDRGAPVWGDMSSTPLEEMAAARGARAMKCWQFAISAVNGITNEANP